MKRLIFFNYIILLLHSFCFSQNKDSLWTVYNNASQADTNRLKALYDISWAYIYSNPDTAIILSEQQLQLAQRTKQRKYEGIALKTIGVSFLNKDNSQKALEYLLQALKINEELGDKQGIGSCSNNIGAVYQYQSNFTKALEYYLKSLKISEERGDKQWIAACYSNIGLIYDNQGDYTKALSFHFRALKIREELGDKQGIGTCYNNIGIIYIGKLDYPKALEYQLKALKISEEIDDLQGIGSCYGNIASIYMGQLNYSKALEFNMKSLKIRKAIDDKQGIGVCYNVMAKLYNKLLDFKLAILYSDSSLQIAKEIDDIDIESSAYQNLATAYSKTNKYKDAYEAHVKFVTLIDSIFNTDNNKRLGDLKTNFEVEKRETELKAIAETQQAISNVEQKRQQFVIYAGSAMFILVFVFAAFMFNRFKVTQKQKRIIEKQKQFVEENQKEIIDSITYAKRLQQAILPSTDEVKKYLPTSFIYYKPKDIIAGDFYWLEHLDDITYIAAADSTGHGVPGAIVSVVCSNALNRAVKEFGLRDAGKILDKTRELVLETFQKSGEEIKDGMDISLLAINKNKQQIYWSGANNRLWYISDGVLKEIKPDKQSIGQTDNPTPFTTHMLDLQKGDTFYLMTDGYADQFGGDKGKKFKYKQLEMLLINNSAKSLEEQKELLNKSFEDWKGNLGQVDDVTIIGIKI
ncbi:MAG: tetratricopeptide repeat protein [Bacteroidia bacterium]